MAVFEHIEPFDLIQILDQIDSKTNKMELIFERKFTLYHNYFGNFNLL